MGTWEWILVGGLLALVLGFLIYAVIKRRRLFYNASFTSETVWKNFQGQDKQAAVEYTDYLKHEEEDEDDAGEGDIKS